MKPTEEDLIYVIIAEGHRVVITSESVLLGQTRPLVVHYTSSLGTAVETWNYVPGNEYQPDWGAITGIQYSYVPPESGSIEDLFN